MPNWIRVKVQATNEVVSALKNDKGEIDFNKIILQPDIYEEFGIGVPCLSYFESFITELKNKGIGSHSARSEIEKEAEIFTNSLKKTENTFMVDNAKSLALQAFCELTVGFKDPLEWNRQHWGTKWNAETIEVNNDSFEIETAWNYPKPLLIALSKKFPDVLIKVDYADEDLGYNCGSFELKNGEFESILEDDDMGYDKAFEFACELWGYDPEEIRQERQ